MAVFYGRNKAVLFSFVGVGSIAFGQDFCGSVALDFGSIINTRK